MNYELLWLNIMNGKQETVIISNIMMLCPFQYKLILIPLDRKQLYFQFLHIQLFAGIIWTKDFFKKMFKRSNLRFVDQGGEGYTAQCIIQEFTSTRPSGRVTK